MTLLEALKNIRDDGPQRLRSGICANLETHRGESYVLEGEFLTLAQGWPKFSGDRTFPVPHPRGSYAISAYDLLDKWSKHSAYGRLRWELVHWCIAELEKDHEAQP